MESSLRPRDIQSRIRAGESVEDVAVVAGTTVEKVMIFAGPVLAERAHVARSAQSASVRRRSGDATSQVRTLGPAAAMRLRDEGVDPESVEWDAWRRDDGRWTLTAAYHHDAQERLARFCFDQPGHFVSADDDEGRWLIGDGAFTVRQQGLRLAPEPRYPAATELGDDALELVSHGDADWIAPTGPAEPIGPVVPEQPAPERPAAAAAHSDKPPAPTQLPPPPRDAAARKNRRASVPSWDEIMFGGGRAE